MRNVDDGSCSYLTDSWLVKYFAICLKLTSDETVKVADLEYLVEAFRATGRLSEDWTFPWSSRWVLFDILAFSPETLAAEDEIPIEIIVTLLFQVRSSDFDINKIERYVRMTYPKPVRVLINNKTIPLKQTIAPQCEYLKAYPNPKRCIDVIVFGSPDYICYLPQTETFGSYLSMSFQITHQFLCDQIEFLKSELENSFLEHPELEKVYQSGDFARIENLDSTSIRICLEDSGYALVKDTSSGALSSAIDCVLLAVSILVLSS